MLLVARCEFGDHDTTGGFEDRCTEMGAFKYYMCTSSKSD